MSTKITEDRAEKLRNNSEDPKKIILQDAINRAVNNYEPIFVMNATDRNNRKERGHVFISIDGATSGLRIPDTFIPIEVTTMFPAKKLAESSEFLQAIENHLTIHDPDECRIFMENTSAKAELERLRNVHDKFDKDIAANMRDLQVEIAPRGPNDDNDGIKFDEEVAAVEPSKYGPDRIPDATSTNDREAEGVLWRIHGLINDPETDHAKLYSPLRTIPNLSIRDVNYILKRVSNETIVTWARQKLANLKEARALKKQRAMTSAVNSAADDE